MSRADPPTPQITVYWRPGCPSCMVLRVALALKGVATTRINIWDDPAAAATVRRAAGGNETVPTVEVGGRYLVNPTARQVMAAAGIGRGRRSFSRRGGRRPTT